MQNELGFMGIRNLSLILGFLVVKYFCKIRILLLAL